MGKPIVGEVKIIPQAKYPFSVTETKALDGKNILFKLDEVTNPQEKGYVLRVENIKKEKGRYRDTILLKTTSEIMPELKIRIFGNIIDPKSDPPAQGDQNMQKFLDAIKKQQSKNAQSGDGQGQQKVPPEDARKFFEQLLKQNQEKQKNSAAEQ